VTWFIRKNTRYPQRPYGGPACGVAGVKPYRLYDIEAEAHEDARKLRAVNPAGFDVVCLADAAVSHHALRFSGLHLSDAVRADLEKAAEDVFKRHGAKLLVRGIDDGVLGALDTVEEVRQLKAWLAEFTE